MYRFTRSRAKVVKATSVLSELLFLKFISFSRSWRYCYCRCCCLNSSSQRNSTYNQDVFIIIFDYRLLCLMFFLFFFLPPLCFSHRGPPIYDSMPRNVKESCHRRRRRRTHQNWFEIIYGNLCRLGVVRNRVHNMNHSNHKPKSG